MYVCMYVGSTSSNFGGPGAEKCELAQECDDGMYAAPRDDDGKYVGRWVGR